MNLDKIVVQLGGFGLYQKWIYFLICLSAVFVGLYSLMTVIFLMTPDHRCKIPGLDNDSYAVQGPEHQLLINNYIPPPSDDEDYDQCHLYSFTYNTSKFDNSSRPINTSLIQCTEWVYSDAVLKETFTARLDIVCDKSPLRSMVKSLYFVGKFFGALLLGSFSDAFGRKRTFYIALIATVAVALAMSWSYVSFVLYAGMVVVIGILMQGIFTVGFVLGMELVGPSERKYAGIIMEYFFALGLIIMVGVSYFVRHWHYINLICSVPAVLFVSYWWMLSESPRWLISKHKYEEAKAVFQRAAKVNKVTLDSGLFEKQVDNEKSESKGNFWQLFSSRVMLRRTLVIFFNWCAVCIVYYGLSLNAGNLGGNFYFNMFLNGLVEFPANTMLLLLLDRVGRKRLYCICMIVGGLSCVATIIPILYGEKKYQTFIITMAMIGKFGASASFNNLYIFSAELFPTVVRNAGLGASSSAARIGGILAPYIADSGAVIGGMVGKVFPLGFFGVLSIIAGLSSLYLPETANKPLPETIHDGKMLGKAVLPDGDGKEENHIMIATDLCQEGPD